MGSTSGRFLLAVAASCALWAVPSAAVIADEDTALRDEALRLNDVTGEDPTTGKIVSLLESPAHSKKLLAVATKLAKEKDQPFQINATYILARTAHGLREIEAGELFYRLNAEQALKLRDGPRLGRAYQGLSGLLFEARKFAESEKVCRELLEIPVDDRSLSQAKSTALRRLIMALAKQNKVDEAMRIVDELLKNQPENWLLMIDKAQVQREAGRFEQSAKTYEDVLERITKDKELSDEERKEYAADIRYILSAVYIDMKQVSKAADQLKTLLSTEPDNPTYNNDLGYIWADNDMNLDESERMIRKALDEDRKLRKKRNPDLKPEDDKDNASFLDSLGWVLFKKKQLAEAKKYLLQAIEDKEGHHLEIFDHLGDVHMALGEKAKAIEAWKKGLEVAGPTKREQEKKEIVEKKLKAVDEK